MRHRFICSHKKVYFDYRVVSSRPPLETNDVLLLLPADAFFSCPHYCAIHGVYLCLVSQSFFDFILNKNPS